METATNSESQTESLEQLNVRYATAFIPFVVVLAIMALIGVIGNVMVLLVFCLSREYKNTNFKIFVIYLASLDLLSCLIMIPSEIVRTQHYFYYSSSVPCKVKCFLNVFFITSAAIALVAICVERFRKVCQPLKKQIRPQLALKIVIFALAFSILMSVPAPIMCGIKTGNKTNIYNTTTVVDWCTAEKKYEKSILRSIYKGSLTSLLFAISVALIVMYILIGKVVFRHTKVQTLGRLRKDSNNPDRVSGKEKVHNSPEDIAASENADDTTLPFESDKKAHNESTGSSVLMGSRNNHENQRKRSTSKTIFARRLSTQASRRVPYKTLIWFLLTIIFVVTYFTYVIVSFIMTTRYRMSPEELVGYTFLFRVYFVNHIVNPIIYAWLDRRFLPSCKELLRKARQNTACSSKG